VEFASSSRTTPGISSRKEPDASTRHHDELEYVIAADQGRLQIRVDHRAPFLDEYRTCRPTMSSPISRARDQADPHRLGHLQSAAQVNHPAKLAERVAMLDHISEGARVRYGRGAGSHEILASSRVQEDERNREMWEDVIGEFRKMWMQDEYEGYEGKFWSLPPRKVMRSRGRSASPDVYACGNTSSYEIVRAARSPACSASPSARSVTGADRQVVQGHIANAEPVGGVRQRQHHVTSAAFVKEDGNAAVKSAVDAKLNYYRATCSAPRTRSRTPSRVPYWPELIPDYDADTIRGLAGSGRSSVATRPGVEQCKAWNRRADQLVFGSVCAAKKDTLEMIKLMGEHVIPRSTATRCNRSSRMRDAYR